jgi:hypothetical protein
MVDVLGDADGGLFDPSMDPFGLGGDGLDMPDGFGPGLDDASDPAAGGMDGGDPYGGSDDGAYDQMPDASGVEM